MEIDTRGYLVVQENRTTGLQQVLVDETENADVVLRAGGCGNDGMIVVDDFLEAAHVHGRPTHIVDQTSLLLVDMASWHTSQSKMWDRPHSSRHGASNALGSGQTPLPVASSP